MPKEFAAIGVSDHAGWSVLVTMGRDATPLDSRRIALVDEDLPSMPHHHDAQNLPLEEALALVERVRVSAGRHAKRGLKSIAQSVDQPVRAIALRACPPLPPTVAERLSNYRAQNVADWVMYRMALAEAAASQSWSVHWFDAKTVLKEACSALSVRSLDPHFERARKFFGPPWNKDHKLAMAAAIVAARPTQLLS